MDREEILKNLILIGDRGKFIKAFLGIESSDKLRMEADADEECAICQEKYGTPTSAEYKIQLPCCGKHAMGSKCIGTWLRKNNTCPLCRQEFFPESGYKIDEDGNYYSDEDEVEDEDDDYRDISDGYDQQQLDSALYHVRKFCHVLCYKLGLRAPGDLAVHVATELAHRLCHFQVFPDCATHVDFLNLAAACIYMASYITWQPLTMDEIASGIDYLGEAVYGYWIVDQKLVELLGAPDILEVLGRSPPLPFWPRSPEHEAYQSRTREYVVSHGGTWREE